MKRLVIVLLLLIPWAMRSMEPEEKAVELKQETVTQGRPSLVRLVEEELPGDIPSKSATRISQVIAQEILRKKPHIRQFILDTISLPFRDFEVSNTASNFLSSIEFNSTGDKMVTLSTGPSKLAGTVKIWEAKTGKLIHTFRESQVRSNPAGDTFLIFSDEGACLWNAETNEFITLEDHTDRIWSAAFTPAGDRVATGSRDGSTAKAWDVKTGKLLRTFKHETWWWPVAFNQAGDHVATGSRDGTAMIWNIEKGTLLHTLKSESQRPLLVVGFNATGDTLVTTAETSDIRIWDLRTEKALLIPGRPAMNHISASDKVVSDTSPSSFYPEHIDIWDIEAGTCKLNALPGQCNGFSPAGDKVVTLQHNKAIIWDVETGEKRSLKHEHVDKVLFNAAGDNVLTIQSPVCVSKGDRVKIWEVKTGKLLHIIRDDSNECWAAAFNPAGDKVAVHLGGKVRVFDLEPLFKSLEFLTEITPMKEISPTSITHRQVALLLDIYDIIKNSTSPKSSEEVSRAQKQCTFDFNNHPESIWNEYNALPEAIRRIFDPYITKPSSTRDGQATLGS